MISSAAHKRHCLIFCSVCARIKCVNLAVSHHRWRGPSATLRKSANKSIDLMTVYNSPKQGGGGEAARAGESRTVEQESKFGWNKKGAIAETLILRSTALLSTLKPRWGGEAARAGESRTVEQESKFGWNMRGAAAETKQRFLRSPVHLFT